MSKNDLREVLPTIPKWAAAGTIAAAVAVAFAPIIVGGESIYHLDTYFQQVPFWQYAAERIGTGEWPWWTPNIRAGYPLHANGEAALLYPLTWPFRLFAPLPAHRAIDAFALGHLWLLGVLTYAYLREIDVPQAPALFGAIAFALSGRMVATTIWPNAVAASCYLPALLIGIERCRSDVWRGGAWIAAGVALGFLAGRPQHFVPALLLAGAYSVAIAGVVWRMQGRLAPAGRLLAASGLAVGVGVAIAAPQVLPSLALVSDSIWADGVLRSSFEFNSLRGKPPTAIWLPASSSTWPEARLYPGIGIAVCALLGCLQLLRPAAAPAPFGNGRRDPRAVFFLVASAVCLWFAYAGPGAHAISQAIPVLENLRAPVRFLFPCAFAIGMFATLSLRDALTRWPVPRLAALALAVLACAELFALCWWSAPTAPSSIYAVESTFVRDGPELEIDPLGFRYRLYSSGFWVAPQLAARLDSSELEAEFAALPPTRNLPMRYGEYSSTGYGEPKLNWKIQSYKRLVRKEMNQLGVRQLYMKSRLRSGGYVYRDRHGASFVYSNPTPMHEPSALPRCAPQATRPKRCASGRREASTRVARRSWSDRSIPPNRTPRMTPRKIVPRARAKSSSSRPLRIARSSRRRPHNPHGSSSSTPGRRAGRPESTIGRSKSSAPTVCSG